MISKYYIVDDQNLKIISAYVDRDDYFNKLEGQTQVLMYCGYGADGVKNGKSYKACNCHNHLEHAQKRLREVICDVISSNEKIINELNNENRSLLKKLKNI